MLLSLTVGLWRFAFFFAFGIGVTLADAQSGSPDLVVVNASSAYPEGPSVVNGVLYYAEMGNDRILRFDGARNAQVWSREGCGPTSVVPRGDGSMVVLCHREEVVLRIATDGDTLEVIHHDAAGESFRNPNAAASDRRGGVYFSSSGSFAPSAAATGAILYLDAEGRLTRVAEGIHYANGVAVSPDGKTLYASEHLERRVLAFAITDDGTLSERRIFVALDALVAPDPERSWEVGPDGLTVDAEGNLIVAEYGGGRLLVVDRDGRLTATVPVPEHYVTSSALSEDRRTLFITAPASLADPSIGAVYATAYPIPAP